MSMLPRGIPGPRILPLIGTAWTYLPYIGTGDDPERLTETYWRKYQKFGDIFAERLGSKTFVSLFNPRDIERVYQNEGRLPHRISHDIMLHIRRTYPEMFSHGGITPTNGEEWYKLRQQFQQEIANPENVYKYFSVVEETSAEFVQFLDEIRKTSNGMVSNVLPHLHHWALENITSAVLGSRMDKFGFNRKPICNNLIKAADDLFDAIKDAEYSRTWKYFNTKTLKKATDNEFFFYKFVSEFVDNIEDSRRNGTTFNTTGVKSVLEKYLDNEKIDIRDTITTTADLVLAGLFTTALSASTALHHLGHNPEKQEIAYQQIKANWPPAEPRLTREIRQKLPYITYCIKESMRLNPVTLGTGRVLVQDLTLGGFPLKKGTILITHNGIAGQLEKFVPRATDFVPERFVFGSKEYPMHKYTFLPFSFGARSCIGKSFASMEMDVFIAQVLRKFRIVSRSPKDIRIKTKLINIPDTPIDIQLIPRE